VFTLPFLDAANNTCGSWKYNKVKYRVYIGYTHTHTYTYRQFRKTHRHVHYAMPVPHVYVHVTMWLFYEAV